MRRLFSQPYQRRRLLLVLGDLLLITGSLLLVLLLDSYWKNSPPLEFSKTIVIYLGTFAFTIFIYYILDLYNLSHKKRPDIMLLSLILGIGIVAIIFSSLSYFFIFIRPGKINLLLFISITGVLTYVWHYSFLKLIKIKPQQILFIGKEKIFKDISIIIHDNYSNYYNKVGHWHSHNHNPTLPNLCDFIKEKNIDLVVYSVHSTVVRQITNDLLKAKFSHKRIIDAYNFYQRLTWRYPIYFLEGFWLLVNTQNEFFSPVMAINLKRAFDLLCAIILLLLAFPLVLVAALAIKLDSEGPVFFIQERLGQNEVPFRLIKLRTMIHDAEHFTGPKWCTENDPRITRVGKVLRKLRIDELPQLFNVLKGEMSMVGPRPIRQHFTEVLAKSIPFYKLRLLAKPGITGWAAVHNGHAHTNEGHSLMLQYDLFYLAQQSIWLDLYIILKTTQVMVWGKGT
jgi:exopolysaccharide biosynthesis polyprenyl glycosylphosphotransferase